MEGREEGGEQRREEHQWLREADQELGRRRREEVRALLLLPPLPMMLLLHVRASMQLVHLPVSLAVGRSLVILHHPLQPIPLPLLLRQVQLPSLNGGARPQGLWLA